jgi:hypothetical protein
MTTQRQNTEVEGSLQMWGRSYPFFLEHQTIELGPAGTIDYYYMPSSALRAKDSKKGVTNFRSILDFYWCILESAGIDGDEQIADYLLATSYALLGTDKSVQKIYRDSFLKRRSFRPDKLSLPEDTRKHIQDLIAGRRKEAVRQELAKVLEATQLTEEDEIASSVAMENWLGCGIDHYRRNGHAGVIEWLRDLDHWYKKFRKRSPQRVQTFLRVFAYEAKVSFYHKYTNFWISVLQWLQRHQALDLPSRRFLSLWHNQNQRGEIEHAAAAIGVKSQHGNMTKTGPFGGRLVDGGTREVIPDVFCGQVLALHPLSWILLDRPELCQMVGRFLTSPNFDQAMEAGEVDDFAEYWEMVEAVLIAAHLYQLVHLSQESSRRQPTAGLTIVPETQAPPGGELLTPDAHLREYVESLEDRCACGGKYVLGNGTLPPARNHKVEIPVICKSCKRRSQIKATQHDMERFLELTHRSSRGRRPK